MDKCFPNLMIQNLEVLRDLSHVFNLNSIAYSRDVKVGLWQENPNHSWYTFGDLICTMFGSDLASKYDTILMDDERWHPQNTKK